MKVLEAVNKIRYGRSTLSTNRQQVSVWVSRARDNGFQVTSVQQDYTRSSQNRRKFHDFEQQLIRDTVRHQRLKCNEMQSIYSIEKNERISVSESSVRRILKRPFREEPSMVAAKPKGYRVGGNTAHHNKCRYVEAKYWNSMNQEDINGIWFADESKMTFREHPNKQIDIQWVLRGEATEANWYEHPRHPGQINLFIVQSIHGIELYGRHLSLRDITSHFSGQTLPESPPCGGHTLPLRRVSPQRRYPLKDVGASAASVSENRRATADRYPCSF